MPFGNDGASPRLSFRGRLIALVLALGCLMVLVTAASITPARKGVETHLQLGLSPCSFYRTTGIPGPDCGMTTSFAWFVRGNLVASFYVQPMGFVLALLTMVTATSGVFVALTGQPVYSHLRYRVYPPFVLMILVIWALAAWAWKAYSHAHGLDGWP